MPGRASQVWTEQMLTIFSVAAPDHARGHRAADQEGAGEVGVQDPFEVVGRDLEERFAVLYARVVDQDVQRADPVLDFLDRRLYGRLVGDVEGHGVHLGPGAFGEFGAGAFQGLGIAAVEDEFGARLGQSRSQGESDALAGSGDQGQSAGEVEQRRALG